MTTAQVLQQIVAHVICVNLTEQVIGRLRKLGVYYGKNCQNCQF